MNPTSRLVLAAVQALALFGAGCHLFSEMESGARLVLIEFREGALPEGPPESVKISRAQLVELVTTAGLVLDSERADLLPYQTFLVFKKP